MGLNESNVFLFLSLSFFQTLWRAIREDHCFKRVCAPVGSRLAELVHAAPHGADVLVDLSDADVPEVAGLFSSQ